MKQICIWAFLCTLTCPAMGQLTLNITATPLNTPAGSAIHAVGTFNNWNPADAATKLTEKGQGTYQIVLNPPVGEVKIKFTRGTWPSVEGNGNGGYLPDRVLQYNGQATTLNLSILTWEDLGSTSAGGTATSNVHILNNAFYMPQLNRNRRVWVYLPPDYQNTNKKYPVLYMQDGQNLFDQTGTFSGEWKIDESLNTLHAQGNWGCIVVGVDNGEQFRLDEYSPWVNTQYGGGQGDELLDFMVNTLKPHIDSRLRTLPNRKNTAIMGSSMGALMAMYAFSERQDIYAKAGIFSPAFWFAGQQPAEHVVNHPKQGNARVYFLAGADEEDDGNQSNYVVEDMQAVATAFSAAGFDAGEKRVRIQSDGKHSEWFWAREFPSAYQWLFADFTSGAVSPTPNALPLEIFPNPTQSWVRVAGLAEGEEIQVQIIGADGKFWQNTSVSSDQPIWTGDLPVGFYFIKAQKHDGTGGLAKLIRS